ncbi:MAG: SDR family NAD(P)-dependent oxidoreductase, partial [Bacteroidetes bacterium]|nr:SDR family NAD(P)-dependent oxidoreductase [Bacteroidota bacterium]
MVAVISGATRGLGKAIALALAQQGYSLALASRNSADLEKLYTEIT